MKIKKTCISTIISDLYGKDNYQSHIEVGKEYWYFFYGDDNISKKTQKYWNKIKITYVRSGCLFYVFPDEPDIPEEFCPVSCFMTSRFILAELDPIKDLKNKQYWKDINTEAAKIQYCFDDEHTIVKNWTNEKEIEFDEQEIYEKFGNTADYYMIKMLEVKGEK